MRKTLTIQTWQLLWTGNWHLHALGMWLPTRPSLHVFICNYHVMSRDAGQHRTCPSVLTEPLGTCWTNGYTSGHVRRVVIHSANQFHDTGFTELETTVLSKTAERYFVNWRSYTKSHETVIAQLLFHVALCINIQFKATAYFYKTSFQFYDIYFTKWFPLCMTGLNVLKRQLKFCRSSPNAGKTYWKALPDLHKRQKHFICIPVELGLSLGRCANYAL